jgi:hypothetical protein
VLYVGSDSYQFARTSETGNVDCYARNETGNYEFVGPVTEKCQVKREIASSKQEIKDRVDRNERERPSKM